MKKKSLLIPAIFVFMILSSFTSYASVASDKKQMKQAVYQYLEAVDNYDSDNIISCFQPRKYRKGFITWNNSSVYTKVIRKLHKDYFLYKISSVSVKGKKGNVTVRVRYYDAYDLVQNGFDDAIYDWGIYHLDASESELQKKIYSYTMKEYKNEIYPEYYIKCKTVKIPMVKVGGKWKIQKMTKSMQNFTDCRTVESINKIDY